MFLVIVCCLRAGQKSFFQDSGVAALVEGDDAKLLVCILFDDTECIFVGVERSHKDKRNIDSMLGVEMLT